jgi:hypothetical protein
MSSTVRRSEVVRAAAWIAVLMLGSGCRITHLAVGSELRADPAKIAIGETTMGQVLADFGAPERIQRQSRGDVFIYRFLKRDSRTLSIEEPVVTNTELYTYTEIREDSDRLVVLFDPGGVVTAYGFQRGASGM